MVYIGNVLEKQRNIISFGYLMLLVKHTVLSLRQVNY